MEELERAIAVNSLAIAFALTIWLTTSYGLLAQLSGLPELPIIFIAPAAAFIWQTVWFALSIRCS